MSLVAGSDSSAVVRSGWGFEAAAGVAGSRLFGVLWGTVVGAPLGAFAGVVWFAIFGLFSSDFRNTVVVLAIGALSRANFDIAADVTFRAIVGVVTGGVVTGGVATGGVVTGGVERASPGLIAGVVVGARVGLAAGALRGAVVDVRA